MTIEVAFLIVLLVLNIALLAISEDSNRILRRTVEDQRMTIDILEEQLKARPRSPLRLADVLNFPVLDHDRDRM